jgi:transcriptional regulator NrdR family protein
MKCPRCGSQNTFVVKTRQRDDAIVRQRQCECGHQFHTEERRLAVKVSTRRREVARA